MALVVLVVERREGVVAMWAVVSRIVVDGGRLTFAGGRLVGRLVGSVPVGRPARPAGEVPGMVLHGEVCGV